MLRPRLVTFDVYTALVDIESGLVPAVREIFGGTDAAAFVRLWRSKQLEYAQLSNSLQRERISFRTITRRALDYTMCRTGIAATMAQRAQLEAAWDRLPPWPEAPLTLAELPRRGYRLALLSNGDAEMLRALVSGWDVDFEILASDQAGHYKPHPAVYALPSRLLGVPPDEVLHVAGSGNDVLGCKLAGLRCAWSNRNADCMLDPEVRPDHELRDLSGLLRVL